jgi:glycosyltransferase involved in cell wall biosynthesis
LNQSHFRPLSDDYGLFYFLYTVKVLILHQYFNTPATGGALRSYYLATALAQQGIETKVITTHNHPERKTIFVEGVEVHYLPIPYDNRFGFVKRAWSFLNFVWSIVREAGHFKDAHVCYAISTPLTIGLAAIWIKKRYRIPYLFEVGDLWPEAPIQLRIIKNPILKVVLYKLEKSIYKRAQAIVALSEAIKTEIQKKVSGKQIHVISNMADIEFFKRETKRPDLEEKFGVQGKFVVSYIGTMGLANGLDFILACAEASQTLPIQFLFCGEGAMLPKLKEIAWNKKLSNVTFIAEQNREGVRNVLNVTDAVFVSYKPLPVLETGSPNKYFDGLAAGKLMIVNVGGWMKEEVEKNGCGISVIRQDDFVEKISPFIQSESLLQKNQEASIKVAEEYSRKSLSNRFASLLNS